MHIVTVTPGASADEWLPRAEPVHRQLRTALPDDYTGVMRGIFADGGEMIVAADGDRVLGVAVYRTHRTTFSGQRFYVDDLVTDGALRSRGVGHALLAWLEAEAERRGATSVELESGVQRTAAHKFYFREGYVIPSFSFRKSLVR